MPLNLLHLDDALLSQLAFRQQCIGLGAHESDLRDIGPDVRLWARNDVVELVRKRLSVELSDLATDEPQLTWIGSGDFHHITALLVELLTEAHHTHLTVVQFDNHPDWVAFKDGLHCGSWVRHVLDSGIVDRVIGLGITSRDLAWPELKRGGLDCIASGKLVLFPIRPPRTYGMGEYGRGKSHKQTGRRIVWKEFHPDLELREAYVPLSAIETDAIYITIDKDVLTSAEAHTNWDQGKMCLEDLLNWLDVLKQKYKVVGVDVVGDYSKPIYAGTAGTRLKKWGEVSLDQPRKTFSDQQAATLNEVTNLKLLKSLQAHLC